MRFDLTSGVSPLRRCCMVAAPSGIPPKEPRRQPGRDPLPAMEQARTAPGCLRRSAPADISGADRQDTRTIAGPGTGTRAGTASGQERRAFLGCRGYPLTKRFWHQKHSLLPKLLATQSKTGSQITFLEAKPGCLTLSDAGDLLSGPSFVPGKEKRNLPLGSAPSAATLPLPI